MTGKQNTEDFAKAAYIKLRTTDGMDSLTRDLDWLYQAGYRYIFLDEVTLMEDFIDSAALFSDIYTMMGMHLSGMMNRHGSILILPSVKTSSIPLPAVNAGIISAIFWSCMKQGS